MGLLNSILSNGSDSDDQWKLLFATDLHGSDKCFKKFVNAKSFYDADALILGGDLTGKGIVPIIDETDGWRAEYPNQTKYLDSEDAVTETEQQIRNAGNYPLRLTAKEYADFRDDDEMVESEYRRLEAERLSEWVQLAEEKLNGDSPIPVIGGNDDKPYVADFLDDSDAFAVIDSDVVRLPTGHEVLGYGWSNPTPWDTPRETSEAEIESDLAAIVSEIDDWGRTIANIHCPPHETRIDEAPKLDDNLRPVTTGGQVETEPVGSTAVRSFVEEHQPMVGLHGHIHESQGEFELGETLCVNPGSEYGEGYLNGVLLTISDDEIVQHQFTSG